MMVHCYICREKRRVSAYEKREGYILVTCDRGHEQFIRESDADRLLSRE